MRWAPAECLETLTAELVGAGDDVIVANGYVPGDKIEDSHSVVTHLVRPESVEPNLIFAQEAQKVSRCRSSGRRDISHAPCIGLHCWGACQGAGISTDPGGVGLCVGIDTGIYRVVECSRQDLPLAEID